MRPRLRTCKCWTVSPTRGLERLSLTHIYFNFSPTKTPTPPPTKTASKPPVAEFDDPSILNMGSTLPPALASGLIDQKISATIARLGQFKMAEAPPPQKEKEAYTWQQTHSMLNGNRYRGGGRDSPRVSRLVVRSAFIFTRTFRDVTDERLTSVSK